MPFEDPRRHRLDRVAVADVAQLDLAAELVRERPEPVLAPGDEHAPPPVPGEEPGGRLADARRGSGDDGDATARRGPIAGGSFVGRHAASI